jgi:Amiloride-sensitive sodium channel
MFILLMHDTTGRFAADQIVIKLSESQLSIEEVPFPAVTICPEVVEENLIAEYENLRKLKEMNLKIEK